METEKTEQPEPIPVYPEDEHQFSGLRISGFITTNAFAMTTRIIPLKSTGKEVIYFGR